MVVTKIQEMALVDKDMVRSDARGETGSTYTLDEALQVLGFGRFQVAMLLYAGLAWLGDAMEMLLLSFLGNAVKCDFGLTETQKDWVTASVFLGMMVGAQGWGALSDAKGRKVGFLIPACITAISGYISAAAQNYEMLLVFRCLVGVGLGGVHVPFALFMEFVPTGHRGLWLSILQGFWTIGALFEAGLAWGVMPWKGWRVLLVLSATPLVVLLILYPLLPESPHFLLAKGEVRKAQAVLERAALVNGVTLPPGNLRHVNLDPEMHASHRIQHVTPKALVLRMFDGVVNVSDQLQRLFAPELRRTAIIFMFVWLTNALSYYGLVQLATEFHKGPSEECLPSGEPLITANEYRDIFVTTIAEVPGVILAGLFVDSWGRRPLMGSTLILTAVFTFPLVLNLSTHLSEVFLFISRMFIVCSFTVIFIYTPEAYPTTIRSFGFGVDNSFSRIGGLMSPFIVGQLAAQNKAGTAAGILMGFSLSAGIATFLIPVETARRALKETFSGDVQMVQDPGQITEKNVFSQDNANPQVMHPQRL